MLIQVHMLQNFVPANMNRGEWGEPKSTMFGGHRRGRISSQCWKRAIRDSEYFTQEFEKHLLGIRTVELPYQIGHALAEMNVSDEIVKKIVAKVPEIGRKAKEEEEAKEENGRNVPNAVSKLANAKSRHSRPNPSSKSARSGRSSPKSSPNNGAHPETGQLIYFAVNEVRDLAKQMNALYQQVGDQGWSHVHLEKTLVPVSPEAVDIALFGRWVTSNAFSRVEASVQVAHAISTHAQSREFDYYTALDDLSRQAGMLGEIEHNSSLYYRYFNVHWEQLRGNLKEDTALARRVLAAFLKAAICAVPHGMSNQYANFNLPDWVLIEIGEDNLALNYANAFLNPVEARANASLMDNSIAQLQEYVLWMNDSLDTDRKQGVWARSATLQTAAHFQKVRELLEWVDMQVLQG